MTVIIMAYSMPLWLAVGFYFGYKLGKGEKPIKKQPLKAKLEGLKRAVKIESEQQKRERIMATNIENFGTNVPQIEV